jgi:hypothetical protein
VFLTEALDRFGFHPAVPIVDDFGACALWEIQNILVLQPVLEQKRRLPGCLVPGNTPLDSFAGVLTM